MSLWFPVMVNDTRIGEVVIRRTEPLKSFFDTHEYEWTVSMNGKESMSGSTTHRYSDGALTLIRAVLEDVES